MRACQGDPRGLKKELPLERAAWTRLEAGHLLGSFILKRKKKEEKKPFIKLFHKKEEIDFGGGIDLPQDLRYGLLWFKIVLNYSLDHDHHLDDDPTPN